MGGPDGRRNGAIEREGWVMKEKNEGVTKEQGGLNLWPM